MNLQRPVVLIDSLSGLKDFDPEDVPKPGPCCAPGTVRQLCDECWAPLRDFARAHGMPEHMVGQLRARIYRMSPEESAEFEKTAVKVHLVPGFTHDHVLDALVAKRGIAEAILKG